MKILNPLIVRSRSSRGNVTMPFWTLVICRDGRFIPEFGSFVRGEAIAKMSEWRRKGVRRRPLAPHSEGPPVAAGLFQVLALKCLSVYHLTIWLFNFKNSALLVKH